MPITTDFPTTSALPLASEIAQNSAKSEQSIRWRLNLLLAQTIVFALLALVCAEGAARVVAAVGQWDARSSEEYVNKLALAKAPCSDRTIFFLGSSFTSKSIYADYLQKRLQQSGHKSAVLNLATMAGRPLDQLNLLEAAVASGRQPVAVFYDVSPLALFMSARDATKLKPAPCLPYLFVYHERLADLLRNLPAILLNPAANTPLSYAAKTVPMSIDGWEPSFGVTDTSRASQALSRRKMLISSSKGALSFDGLLPVQKFCSDRHIPLILVWYPSSPAADSITQDNGLSNDTFLSMCASTARDWRGGFINLHVPIDEAYLYDCDHLNAAGSVSVTEQMVRVLSSPQFTKLMGTN